LENDGRPQKTGGRQDWKMKITDEIAKVANNGLENDGRDRKSGKCRTGK